MFNSPQENANAAWKALGQEMGFQWDSGHPRTPETSMISFAEPLQVDEDK